MKFKNIKRLVLIILLISTYKFTFSQSLVISKQYQFTTEKPILINAGANVLFEADSIYLINAGRYRFYENLRELLNKDLSCNKIISAYENSIVKNNILLNDLLENSQKSKQLTEKTLFETSKALNFINSKLKANRNNLDKANLQIKELKKQIKKDKTIKIISYGTIAITGILTGILIDKL